MSDVLYPIGLMRSIKATPFNVVQQDAFEAGNTAAKLQWPAQNFKHKIRITHAPLTVEEYRYLLSFYSQRSGMYDSFWFRDNLTRTGNYKVRFGEVLAPSRDANFNNVEVLLEEVAPRRMLPFIEEVTAAAGLAPFCWYDANRRVYKTHMGVNTEEIAFVDSANGVYPLAIAETNILSVGQNVASSQWQSVYCQIAAQNWMKSTNNVAELPDGSSAVTLFHIGVRGAAVAAEVIFHLGNDTGAGNAFGIGHTGAGKIAFYKGGGTFAGTGSQLVTSTFFQSNAFTLGGGNVKGYANGLLIGTDAQAMTFVHGPVTVGANNVGNYRSDTSYNGQMLAFAGTLSAAQVKALHNLFAPQYGLLAVP